MEMVTLYKDVKNERKKMMVRKDLNDIDSVHIYTTHIAII